MDILIFSHIQTHISNSESSFLVNGSIKNNHQNIKQNPITNKQTKKGRTNSANVANLEADTLDLFLVWAPIQFGFMLKLNIN